MLLYFAPRMAPRRTPIRREPTTLELRSGSQSDVPRSYSHRMTSTNPEPPSRATQIAEAASAWLRTQFPDLAAAEIAELHDRRLAHVVRAHQAGEASPAAVVEAVQLWRTQIGDSTWFDGWDAELVRLIDLNRRAT